MNTNKDIYDFNDLIQLMQRLRDPDKGCPWDVDQTFETIKPHTIEEAYEVADAIETGTMDDLKDELGDLLFQVIFHAQMGAEKGHFDMGSIIDHVTKKMIFRHPHVFGDVKANNALDVEDHVWEQQKAKEKNQKRVNRDHYLDDVTMALPSLSLANKIQKRVRKVGFEYGTIDGVFDKMHEEIEELRHAITSEKPDDIAEEYGDVLLVSSLIGSYLKLNAEQTLRQSCLKFVERFNAVEDHLKSQSLNLEDATIDDMRASWNAIKIKSD